jgi:hypothetical protein
VNAKRLIAWMIRWAVALCCLVFAVWLGGAVVLALMVKGDCMRVGYTDGDVAWDWTRYCVSRQNQSDIVVTLDEAWKAPLK